MSTIIRRHLGVAALAVACLAILIANSCGAGDSSSPSGEPPDSAGQTIPDGAAVITLDTTSLFQTMTGWEAVAQSGQGTPGFSSYRDELFDLAVNDLGINRLRLEIRAGVENTRDYYAERLAGSATELRCERYLSINDNSDPRVIDPAGFKFSAVDSTITAIVLPMRQRMQARGERLYVNLNYVAFLRQCPSGTPYVHDEPVEYAELILAAFLHMRNRYGFVPDAVEIILEPDNVNPPWNGTLIGQSIVATAARLAAEGFHPDFIGPSNSNAASVGTYADAMYAVPGVASLLKELSYHRYAGASDATIQAIHNRARVRGARTAMLEHIGSGVENLYKDLTIAGVSAWQQYTLAFPTSDNGAQYYRIVDGKPVMGDRTRYLRQYFRYVRFGAVRVAATSDNPTIRPVAFRNADGRAAVVIHVDARVPVAIRGLAPGRYGTSLTTKSVTGAEIPEKVVPANGVLVFTPEATGVATVYRR